MRNSASPWPTVGLNAAVGGASGAMHDVLAERGEQSITSVPDPYQLGPSTPQG